MINLKTKLNLRILRQKFNKKKVEFCIKWIDWEVDSHSIKDFKIGFLIDSQQISRKNLRAKIKLPLKVSQKYVVQSRL